jgi:hypothetical protein
MKTKRSARKGASAVVVQQEPLSFSSALVPVVMVQRRAPRLVLMFSKLQPPALVLAIYASVGADGAGVQAGIMPVLAAGVGVSAVCAEVLQDNAGQAAASAATSAVAATSVANPVPPPASHQRQCQC